MIGKSSKLHEAEEQARLEIRQQMQNFIEDFPIGDKLHVQFLFYRNNHRQADLSNLYEFPQDVLQNAGVIKNDAQIESHDGSRKLFDKENPRTEVYIERYDPKKVL